MKVSELMTPVPVTVAAETSLKDAARKMLDLGVSGLPVVGAEGALVGIVTEADFVAKEAEKKEPRRRRLLDLFFNGDKRDLAHADKVGDIMTTEITVIREDRSLAAAAHAMVSGNIKRLPVVDEGGKLVGIVSRADVVKGFARSDEDVAAEVQDLLAKGVLPIEPGTVQVSVHDGIVSLRGEIDARVDAAVLEHVVSRFEGVVRVDNQLTWQVDDNRRPGFAGYPREGVEE
ncbi:MAG: CBS domain-containing protein [Acidimicrobiia bacterium]|nr:CBS domain-containing protein [Acidimicrobiia bacterium]